MKKDCVCSRPVHRHSDSHGHGQDSSEMLPHPREFGAHGDDEDFHKGSQNIYMDWKKSKFRFGKFNVNSFFSMTPII